MIRVAVATLTLGPLAPEATQFPPGPTSISPATEHDAAPTVFIWVTRCINLSTDGHDGTSRRVLSEAETLERRTAPITGVQFVAVRVRGEETQDVRILPVHRARR